MTFGRSSIGTRLFLAFGVLLAALALTAALALWRLYSADGMARRFVDVTLARQQAVAAWRNALDLNAARTLAILKSDSLEVADYFGARLKEGDAQAQRIARRLRTGEPDIAERTLLDRADAALAAYRDVRGRGFAFKEKGRTLEAEALAEGELAAASRRLDAAMDALSRHHDAAAAAIAAQSAGVFRTSVALLLGVGALAVAGGAALAWTLARAIVVPLRDAAHVAGKVAAGDLTTPLTYARRDEIGMLFGALERMQHGLSGMATGIRAGVTGIDEDLAAIAADNDSLAERTRAQSAALRAISGRMQAMSGAVAANAAHVRRADALAGGTAAAAGEGGDAVDGLVATMHAIAESSHRIAGFVEVIDGIAFQTNILALNAAVEAARAGEHGRGFAVVAAEVRTLSQRSAGAAREVRALIGDAVRRIGDGTGKADEAGRRMRAAIGDIGELTAVVAGIRDATEGQAGDLGEVRRSLAEIDAATLRNDALVDDAVRAVADLARQSAQVGETVARFRLRGDAPRRMTAASLEAA